MLVVLFVVIDLAGSVVVSFAVNLLVLVVALTVFYLEKRHLMEKHYYLQLIELLISINDFFLAFSEAVI